MTPPPAQEPTDRIASGKVRKYLEHAVSGEARQIESVRLRMRGAIRLGKRWSPFKATQWLAPERGLDWRASIRMGFARVKGFDRYMDGEAEMRWRVFGILPLVHEKGPDIDRSARGRVVAESVWVPSALWPGQGVKWIVGDDDWLRARWRIDGVEDELRIAVDEEGRLLRLAVTRWGNPDGEGWREISFGADVHEEAGFHGLTVPSRITAGWWYGSERYKDGGEFFRVEIEDLVPEHVELP